MAYLCYIDEAGDSQKLPDTHTDIQPILVIAGLIVSEEAIAGLTTDFLAIKRKYFPKLFTSDHLLDDVRQEVKGSDVRKLIRERGHTAGAQLKFIDETLALLECYQCKILSTIWVKGIAKAFDGTATYTRSVQFACQVFQEFLEQKQKSGLMIADFRTTQLNDKVAHSIFTQKYRAKGDPFGRILELPTFGVSNNHVGLQITDLLCSTLLFPMASSVYCSGHITGPHVHANDMFIRRRYTKRLRKLQFKVAQFSVRVSNQMPGQETTADLLATPPAPVASAAGSGTKAPVANPIVVPAAKAPARVEKRNAATRPGKSTLLGDKLAEAMRKGKQAPFSVQRSAVSSGNTGDGLTLRQILGEPGNK